MAVDGLFERVSKEQDGRLDIMVNNAYAGVDVSSMEKRYGGDEIIVFKNICLSL